MIEQRKKNLKKWQKALIGIAIPIGVLLIAFIVFVIVMMAQSYHSERDADYEKYTTSIAEKMFEFAGGEDEFVEGKIESTPICLSNKHLNEFEAYLSKVNPEYEYSDLYNINATLLRYNKKILQR